MWNKIKKFYFCVYKSNTVFYYYNNDILKQDEFESSLCAYLVFMQYYYLSRHEKICN